MLEACVRSLKALSEDDSGNLCVSLWRYKGVCVRIWYVKELGEPIVIVVKPVAWLEWNYGCHTSNVRVSQKVQIDNFEFMS